MIKKRSKRFGSENFCKEVNRLSINPKGEFCSLPERVTGITALICDNFLLLVP